MVMRFFFDDELIQFKKYLLILEYGLTLIIVVNLYASKFTLQNTHILKLHNFHNPNQFFFVGHMCVVNSLKLRVTDVCCNKRHKQYTSHASCVMWDGLGCMTSKSPAHQYAYSSARSSIYFYYESTLSMGFRISLSEIRKKIPHSRIQLCIQ